MSEFVKIIFSDPTVFVVETSTGTVVGSAVAQLAHGGTEVVSTLTTYLLQAVVELNAVRDLDARGVQLAQELEKSCFEPPEYFRGTGDSPG